MVRLLTFFHFIITRKVGIRKWPLLPIRSLPPTLSVFPFSFKQDFIMKTKIFVFSILVLALPSCESLDLNPLSQGSSETWNSNPEEIEMSLNGIYRGPFWTPDDE